MSALPPEAFAGQVAWAVLADLQEKRRSLALARKPIGYLVRVRQDDFSTEPSFASRTLDMNDWVKDAEESAAIGFITRTGSGEHSVTVIHQKPPTELLMILQATFIRAAETHEETLLVFLPPP